MPNNEIHKAIEKQLNFRLKTFHEGCVAAAKIREPDRQAAALFPLLKEGFEIWGEICRESERCGDPTWGPHKNFFRQIIAILPVLRDAAIRRGTPCEVFDQAFRLIVNVENGYWEVDGALPYKARRQQAEKTLYEKGLAGISATLNTALTQLEYALTKPEQSAGALEPVRKTGRLNKQESEVKKAEFLAKCSAHPTLMNDFPALAESVGVSQATCRRWLAEFKGKHAASQKE